MMLRDVKILYWIMGVLLTVALLGVTGLAAGFNERVNTLEDDMKAIDRAAIRLEIEMRQLRLDVCRVEGTLDDMYETMTNKRRSRAPCP